VASGYDARVNGYPWSSSWIVAAVLLLAIAL
jgi:hypothetical protein